MNATPVLDTYWRFAVERQETYFRRLTDPFGPWTDDPILASYRFTNAYRASDRVSQYLIRDVQYRADRSSEARELFFRTILFKLFNKIETWEAVEAALGPISYKAIDLNDVVRVLDERIARGHSLYSAAYIMPSPSLGHIRKHANHIALLDKMMRDKVPQRVGRARDLNAVYRLLLSYPGLGPFLAFQYTIDLNYSEILERDEAEFVVAGPGAIDGIAKCFSNSNKHAPEEFIFWVYEQQEREFARCNLKFRSLFGRRLQPIDCQNLFCEISKYARVAHPDVLGLSGRTKIKQNYRPLRSPMPSPMFPPKWKLNTASHQDGSMGGASQAKRKALAV